jgi:hypothetical protein
MQTVLVVLVALLAAFAPAARAVGAQDLEAGLLNALRLKPQTLERVGSAREAIRAYITAGYLPKKPTRRADYTDYYLLTKPTTLLGHTLIVIEEESMVRYVGCCVSPGIGVTVKIVGSSHNVEQFANNNGCRFADHVDPQADLKAVGIKVHLSKGHYASLSCRERDVER